MKKRKVIIKPFQMICDSFDRGFVMNRDVTLREARYILKRLLGIDINDRNCYDYTDEYQEYNKDLLNDVNNWLKGNIEDSSIMEYASDCSDEPIGIWNAFKIAQYLSKKKII